MLFRGKAIFGLLLVTCLGIASGQTNTTSLSGTVTDASGARLPDTTVTLTDPANGTTESRSTKKIGDFSFPQIKPGQYILTIHHDGFTDYKQTLDMLIATPQQLAVKLSVGTMQSVDVETEVSSSLNRTDATLGKTFDNSQIQTLPYLANNTLSLLGLQPGVISLDSGSTTGGLNTDTRTGIVNGARQDQTNLTLDGVDNNNSNFGYAFNGVLRATRDSIEEFRVTTSGGNADAGRSSGAQVSLETKSGTNRIHGSAYYYYRDPAMASNNWLNKQTQLASGKPNIPVKILQHTYGGSLGLPIIKNKLFFFGAYEGFKQASNANVTAVVPLGSGSAADYGKVAGLRNGTVTYLNAGSTTAYTTLTAAQIAQIDPNCKAQGGCPAGPGVNAAAIAYMDTLPIANNLSGATGDGINTAGFTFVSPAPISQITNIARIDYNLTSRQTLFIRGNLQSDNILGTLPVPTGTPTTITYSGNRGIAGGHIWQINNALVNNFRYGWTRYGSNQQGATSDFVTFSAFNAPFSTTFGTYVLENIHNFVDDFTIVKGAHTFQIGANDRLIYNNRTIQKLLYQTANVTAADLQVGGIANQGTSLDASAFSTQLGIAKINSSGRSSYNNAITAATGLISVGQSYANFVVNGATNSLSALPAGTLPPSHNFKSMEQEYYVQDQWKILPTLTITAGLRYAYLGVPYETNGQQVVPTTDIHVFLANRIAAMKAGLPYQQNISLVPGGKVNNGPAFWNIQKNNFAPRLGIAFAPDPKTTIRAGFQMTYDHFGTGAVNSYNDSYSFGLSSTRTKSVCCTVDADPRFTGPHTVPGSILNPVPAGGAFPVTQISGVASTIAQVFDQELKTPYAYTMNFSLQREVYKGLTITASYDGRLGHRLLLLNDVAMPANLTDPGSGMDYFSAMTVLDKLFDQGVAPANVPNMPFWQNQFPGAVSTPVKNGPTYHGTQAVYSMLARSNETATLQTLDTCSTCSANGQMLRYFDSQFASLYNQSSIGVSNYHSLQLSLRHNINRNFVYDVNYTLSKSMDMGSSPERSQSNPIINTFNPSQMYAVSDFDARHAMSVDWITTLPFGRGQHFLSNASKLTDELVGGWSITGVGKYNSAFPWTAYVGTSGWGTNWDYQSSAVEIAPVVTTGHHTEIPSSSGLITASAVTGGAAMASNFRAAYVGESGQRNELRADGYFSLDPGVAKSFHIRERESFKLTVEAFNVTNAVRFNNVNSGSTAANFGKYTGATLNATRQMQVSGRFYF